MADTRFTYVHDAFVREGMKDPKTMEYKSVDTVAGIGKKCAAELAKVGITNAHHLMVCPQT